MNGWIKLYRELKEWQWYGYPDMVAIWIHLLLSASREDCKWRYVEVKRGQVITRRRELAKETGLTERKVRTCLSRLQTSHDVTIKTTHGYSLITICKWDIYQNNLSQSDPQSDPQNDHETTTYKNIRIKEYSVCDARARLEEATINNQLWLDQTSMSLHSPDVLQVAMDVMAEWELTAVPAEEWTVGHLFNHIRKKLNIKKQEGRPSKQEEKEARRAELKRQVMNELKINGYGNHKQPTERVDGNA